MATIGGSLLKSEVHDLFEGLRTFDAATACAHLASDVDFDSPWTGAVTGKDAVQTALEGWLTDPKERVSMTIMDVTGDGAIVRVKLSVSNRFGRAPQHLTMHVLCLQGVIHQVKFA